MIVQYEIKMSFLEQYQEAMEEIIKMLPSFEAEKFQVSCSSKAPNQFIETITLPTVAHYHALKKLRKSENHNVFGSLDQMILGGLNQMECWAFQTKL